MESSNDRISRSKPSPYAVCIPLTIFSINIGMILGVLQQWVILYFCQRYDSVTDSVNLHGSSKIELIGVDWEYCRTIPEVQSIAAKWSMLISLCGGIPSLIVGPLYGMLSDHIGRKPLIVIPMISGFFLGISLLAVEYGVGIWLLIVQALLSGFLGSYTMIISSILSYFADTTVGAERSKVFTIGESSFFIGIALGPLIGGAIVRNVAGGFRLVFFLVSILSLVIIICTILFLPESLDRPSNEIDQSLWTKLKNIPNLTTKTTEALRLFKAKLSSTFLALLGVTCAQAASFAASKLFFNYTSYNFGWDSQNEGQFIVTSCLSRIFHMLISFPILKRFFGSRIQTEHGKACFEIMLIRFVLLAVAACYIIYPFVQNGNLLYIIAFFEGLLSLSNPVARSLMSSFVSSNSQGLLFTSTSFVEHIITMIFSVVFPMIWTATIKTFPGAYFFVVALVLVVGFLLALYPTPSKLVDSIHRDADETCDNESETANLLVDSQE